MSYLDKKYTEKVTLNSFTPLTAHYYKDSSYIRYDYRLINQMNAKLDSSSQFAYQISKDFDLLKFAPIFQNAKKMHKYRFKLEKGTEDTLIIGFEAKNPSMKYTGFYYLKSYKGYLKVLRKNLAITEIAITAIRDSEQLNKVGKNSYHLVGFKSLKSISEEKIEVKVNYIYDSSNFIYVPNSAVMKFFSKGTLNKNPKDSVSYQLKVEVKRDPF